MKFLIFKQAKVARLVCVTFPELSTFAGMFNNLPQSYEDVIHGKFLLQTFISCEPMNAGLRQQLSFWKIQKSKVGLYPEFDDISTYEVIKSVMLYAYTLKMAGVPSEYVRLHVMIGEMYKPTVKSSLTEALYNEVILPKWQLPHITLPPKDEKFITIMPDVESFSANLDLMKVGTQA